MTTVTMRAGEIRAEGHAGNRDVCLFVEAAFQMAARAVTLLDAGGRASMDVVAPSFAIAYGDDGAAPIAALESLLEELAARYPDHLQLRRDAALESVMLEPTFERPTLPDHPPAVVDALAECERLGLPAFEAAPPSDRMGRVACVSVGEYEFFVDLFRDNAAVVTASIVNFVRECAGVEIPLTLEQIEAIARKVFEARNIGGLRLSSAVEMTFGVKLPEECGSPHPVACIGWRYPSAEGVYDESGYHLLHGSNEEVMRLVADAAEKMATKALVTLVTLGAGKLGYELTPKSRKAKSRLVVAG
jgi:hypothetical protein